MYTSIKRTGVASVSLAALLLSVALAPVVAQTSPQSPAIVLPPLPEVEVKVGPAAAPAPAQAPATPPPSGPAATTAPAITPPVSVEVLSPPRAAPAPAAPSATPPVITATPPAPPAPVAQPIAPPAQIVPRPVETARPLTPAPAPAASVALSDQALRAALEGLAREPRLALAVKQQREQLLAIYAARHFAPFWLNDGGWTPTARGALARLGKASDDGLDLKTTPAPKAAGDDEAARIAAELALTQAVIAYGQQASGGRVSPRSVSHLITEKPDVATADKILASVARASDADAALAAFNPPHPGYIALRGKLAEVRRNRPAEPAQVLPGPTLRIGMKDARVPALRERLKVDADPLSPPDDITYDARIAAAVSAFQRSKALPASGQLNPATVAALAAAPRNMESEIISNMERWRWLPRDQSADRIEVNIPDYTVRVTLAGKLAHTARVVVGKPDTQTPVFSNRMKFLEVNPYWNVPESIIKNEMMPRLAKDPGYLQRQGYEVSTDRKGRMVVRQPPGQRNALGFIKFMFPNEHAVYLHDTPSRSLFANPRRAYSHGCVRVDQPFKLAEVVLGRENGWSEERVKKLIGTGNRTINLPRQLDVHIQYFTVFVDDAGELQTRDDIYGHSRRMKAAMGLTG